MISRTCLSVSLLKSVPLDRYCRISPLVFSFKPDVHQARIRQDEDHEVHRGRLATEQHPSQLAAIDLALHPRQALDWLVITLLT